MNPEFVQWLEAANREFSSRDIPHMRRPFEAIDKWSREQGIAVFIPSQLATEICEWFKEQSPASSHGIGSMYVGAFYYDAFFWRVEIPISYGTVQLNALNSLRQMPSLILSNLQQNNSMMWRYVELWIDTVDYAFGIDDLGKGLRLPAAVNREFAAQLTASADREIRATVQLLTESRTANGKALESSRMATEMFLKAYLAVHAGLNEEKAQKNFGHRLDHLTVDCKIVHGDRSFDELRKYVGEFPPVGERYEGKSYENHRLWTGYAMALGAAVTFTRSITDRDSRKDLRTAE